MVISRTPALVAALISASHDVAPTASMLAHADSMPRVSRGRRWICAQSVGRRCSSVQLPAQTVLSMRRVSPYSVLRMS